MSCSNDANIQAPVSRSDTNHSCSVIHRPKHNSTEHMVLIICTCTGYGFDVKDLLYSISTPLSSTLVRDIPDIGHFNFLTTTLLPSCIFLKNCEWVDVIL